jgi:putative superfamily II helicase
MLGMEYAAYCREIDQQEANPDLFTASSGEYSTVNGVVYLSVYKVLAGKVTKGPKEALFPEIEIIGQARDPDGQGWGRLIAFRNNDGRRLEVLIQDSDLTGKGDNVREALTSSGLPLYSTGRNIARYLCDYIYNRPIVNRENPDLMPQKVAITRRGGWLGDAFITPNGVIGDSEERIYYEPAGNAKANYDQAGSIEKWRDSVGYVARYSSPLTLAICTALAAPLLSRISWLEQKSGGFHFYSTSTVGKTSIAEAAAGVYGKPSPDGGRVISWSGTANALEYVAAAHNDSLLCLDELKTAKPYEVSDIIYRLANSVGKARLDKEINLRAPATWRALWISTGELTVSQYVEQAGYTAQAGTDIRSIPIDVGMGVRVNPTDRDTLGIFEEVPPDFKKISEAFNLLSAGTRENFGVLGFKWLEYLTANAKAVKAQAELFARRFDEKAPKEIGAQQSRELNRFKLCAVAGEIATKAALTGWQEGQATDAVIKLMERYFAGLTTGTKEARRLIESLREAVQTIHKFALYGTSERAEYGYRNFEPCGFFLLRIARQAKN